MSIVDTSTYYPRNEREIAQYENAKARQKVDEKLKEAADNTERARQEELKYIQQRMEIHQQRKYDLEAEKERLASERIARVIAVQNDEKRLHEKEAELFDQELQLENERMVMDTRRRALEDPRAFLFGAPHMPNSADVSPPRPFTPPGGLFPTPGGVSPLRPAEFATDTAVITGGHPSVPDSPPAPLAPVTGGDKAPAKDKPDPGALLWDRERDWENKTGCVDSPPGRPLVGGSNPTPVKDLREYDASRLPQSPRDASPLRANTTPSRERPQPQNTTTTPGGVSDRPESPTRSTLRLPPNGIPSPHLTGILPHAPTYEEIIHTTVGPGRGYATSPTAPYPPSRLGGIVAATPTGMAVVPGAPAAPFETIVSVRREHTSSPLGGQVAETRTTRSTYAHPTPPRYTSPLTMRPLEEYTTSPYRNMSPPPGPILGAPRNFGNLDTAPARAVSPSVLGHTPDILERAQVALDDVKAGRTSPPLMRPPASGSYEKALANLKEFAKDLRVDHLAFDDNYTCVVSVNNNWSLMITWDPITDRVYLYAVLLEQLPTDPALKLKLYQELLGNALLGREMAGGGVGLSRSRQLLLSTSIPMSFSTPSSLRNLAPIFVDSVNRWRGTVADLLGRPHDKNEEERMGTPVRGGRDSPVTSPLTAQTPPSGARSMSRGTPTSAQQDYDPQYQYPRIGLEITDGVTVGGHFKRYTDGVVVVNCKGSAARAGVMPNDIITKVCQW
eukprot:TRINITY_DN67617_c2_g1_i2.p1 TRINITY_DN67617_c2_g1~~TRINITY_DN67617_c2_g1_i2.p1  ORF type:complete len:729 (-),score=82.86 TRINITY_DN67617_c2_g1_i2:146-2332(-)